MTVVSQNGSCSSRRDADELQRIEAIRRDSRDQNDVTRELVELSRDAEFDTETSRQAYLAATASIQSDSLKVEALKGLLRGAPISVETGRGVLAQAKRFGRDDDRAELLSMMHHIRESDLVRGPLVNAYLDIVADLTNQQALSDSLRELLHPREVTAGGVEKALTMLKRVTDPTLRMAVLIEVTDHQRITPSVEAAYDDLSSALQGDLLADAKERLSDAKQQSHRRRSGWFASWGGEGRRDLSPEDDAKRREALERAKEEVKREVLRTRESLRAEEGQIKERARELRQKAKELSQKYKARAREMQEKLRKEFGNDAQLDDELDLDTE